MKVDKLKIVLMGILVLCSIGAMGVYELMNKEEKIPTDAHKFKEEYEDFNEKQVAGREDKYPTIHLEENNPFYYASYEEIDNVLNGTGIIYLGYPECPWCRNLVPLLAQASKKVGIGKIYYRNLKEERNILTLDDGEIKEEKEGSKGYNALVETLKDTLPTYEGLENEEIKRIYVPYVLFVKEGKIVDTHTGTVEDQQNPFSPLTEEEKTKLLDILVDKMMKVADTSCDSAC